MDYFVQFALFSLPASFSNRRFDSSDSPLLLDDNTVLLTTPFYNMPLL